jgi:GAF domain-containing protein
VKVTPEYLETHSQGAEHLALLRRIGARSIMSAPMMTFRGTLLGSLTAASSHRMYDQNDLHLLIEVAQRAAMAIENASLYADLRHAHDEIQTQLHALEEAHERIRTLTGLLPICAWCGRIRDEQLHGEWRRFDEFVTSHTPAQVTHGICPDCAARFLQDQPAHGSPYP